MVPMSVCGPPPSVMVEEEQAAPRSLVEENGRAGGTVSRGRILGILGFSFR